MQDTEMKFSEKFRVLLARENLSQSMMVDMIGDSVSKSTISNWSTGKQRPDIESVLKLARIFRVDVASLIDDDMELKEASSHSEMRLTSDKGIHDSDMTVIMNIIQKLGTEEAIRRLLGMTAFSWSIPAVPSEPDRRSTEKQE